MKPEELERTMHTVREQMEMPWNVKEGTERIGELLDQRNVLFQGVAQMRETISDQAARIATLERELDEARSEIRHRKAMQPTDREGRAITQAAANRLMIAYDANADLRARLEAAERERDELREAVEMAANHLHSLEQQTRSCGACSAQVNNNVWAHLHKLATQAARARTSPSPRVEGE